MKKAFYTLVISLSSFGLFAQTTTETRTVGDFTKIYADGAAEVIMTQGNQTEVKVKGESDELSNIKTEVEGSTLRITTKGSFKEDFKIYVTFKTLEGITTSGAAYVKTDSTMTADKISLESSGASRIKLDILCKNIESNASGASTISLSGATEDHTSFVSGAASLKAYRLSSINTTITTSGASSARINVNQKLKADVSAASSLKYMGKPETEILNVSASASIKHVENEEGSVILGDSDTSKHNNRRWDNKYNIKWNNNDFNFWSGVELNLNGLIGSNGSTSLPANSDYMSINYGIKSLSWNLNIAQKNFHIYKNYVNFVTGIGIGFNAYQFKNPIRLNPDSSFTSYTLDSALTFDKNKLKTSYVQIPLLFEFNTSKKSDHSFHVAVGVIGGYKLTSKTKRTYEINGYDVEEIRKDDYNVNPFKLDATVRIGYGEFTLFGTYGLTPLFEANKGPVLNTFTAGVRIIPF